jgi:hypothetical protein
MAPHFFSGHYFFFVFLSTVHSPAYLQHLPYLVLLNVETMSFTEIPILDLSLARDAETKPAFLAELRHALMEVGFLYLKNVGIEDELFQKVTTLGKAFFDIPMEEKYARKLCGQFRLALPFLPWFLSKPNMYWFS